MRIEEQKLNLYFQMGSVMGKNYQVGKYEFDFDCNGFTLMIYKYYGQYKLSYIKRTKKKLL